MFNTFPFWFYSHAFTYNHQGFVETCHVFCRYIIKWHSLKQMHTDNNQCYWYLGQHIDYVTITLGVDMDTVCRILTGLKEHHEDVYGTKRWNALERHHTKIIKTVWLPDILFGNTHYKHTQRETIRLMKSHWQIMKLFYNNVHYKEATIFLNSSLKKKASFKWNHTAKS